MIRSQVQVCYHVVPPPSHVCCFEVPVTNKYDTNVNYRYIYTIRPKVVNKTSLANYGTGNCSYIICSKNAGERLVNKTN
jgi:acetate kinase